VSVLKPIKRNFKLDSALKSKIINYSSEGPKVKYKLSKSNRPDLDCTFYSFLFDKSKKKDYIILSRIINPPKYLFACSKKVSKNKDIYESIFGFNLNRIIYVEDKKLKSSSSIEKLDLFQFENKSSFIVYPKVRLEIEFRIDGKKRYPTIIYYLGEYYKVPPEYAHSRELCIDYIKLVSCLSKKSSIPKEHFRERKFVSEIDEEPLTEEEKSLLSAEELALLE
jgi:hypothetical protein